MANTTGKGGTEHTPTTSTSRTGDQNRGASQNWGDKDRETTSGGVMTAVKEKASDLASNVSDMAGKAKETVQDWASSAADVAGQAKDRAKEMASNAADTAQEWGRTAVNKAEEWGEDFTGMIRRYPIPALLVSLGVGFLLGQAMRRSSY